MWLNGVQIADKERMAGMFQRFRFDVTAHVRPGRNALAVKIYPVDHPGVPDKQVKVFGPHRGEHKEIERDVTEIETTGYDCMMTVPDRNMGICQEVFLDWTGPVDIRHPFVVTELPLPDTSRATLAVSAELVNAGAAPVRGVLRGHVAGTDVRFEQPVELAPNETKLVRVDPKPVMLQPAAVVAGELRRATSLRPRAAIRDGRRGVRRADGAVRRSPDHQPRCTRWTAGTAGGCWSTARRSSAAAVTSSRSCCSIGTRGGSRTRFATSPMRT